MSPLNAEQIEHLVQTVLHGPTIERPSALFVLLGGVADPAGDQTRYESATTAMRVVEPQTLEYESYFQGRLATVAGAQSKAKLPV